MRLPIVPMIMWIAVTLGSGIWIFNILRKRHPQMKFARYAWLLLVAAVTALAVVMMSTPHRTGDDAALLKVNWMLFVVITFTFPQIVYLLFDLIGRLPRLFGKKRCKWSSRTGIAAAYALFAAMWWGALVTVSISRSRILMWKYRRCHIAWTGQP